MHEIIDIQLVIGHWPVMEGRTTDVRRNKVWPVVKYDTVVRPDG